MASLRRASLNERPINSCEAGLGPRAGSWTSSAGEPEISVKYSDDATDRGLCGPVKEARPSLLSFPPTSVFPRFPNTIFKLRDKSDAPAINLHNSAPSISLSA
ncbi:hypothetical protein E2C01_057260 [Portunus trituberculatus]|uniref:Uncharacterized protein n=1 Tax=Portunus trituberculatus TaxID=210409 RepID=A0A5B7H007_PORTR|nr:hypothetical protein [Portunus trituberculatus]